MFNDIPVPSHIWQESDKIAFHIGSLAITWYGIFVTIGFIMAIVMVIIKAAAWYKLKTDPFYWFCLMAIPVAIIGARFWSCCIGDAQWPEFWNFGTGGLAIEGGVVFTLLLGLWWFPFISKYPKYQIVDKLTDSQNPTKRQVSTWVWIDVILPCILMGQIIGRWGNYFNQELYGPEVTSQATMEWLCHHLPFMYSGDATGGVYYQPLFLYESCTNIIGFLLLYVAFEFIPKLKAGTIGLSYGVWYGVVRVIIEPFRASQYSFTLTYVMSALWILVCGIMILLNQINVIPKTRKYACKLIMWDKMTYGIKSNYYQGKLKSSQKQLTKCEATTPTPDTQAKLQNNLKKYQDKLANYQKKIAKVNDTHKRNQEMYLRDVKHLLYYHGR